MDKICVVTAAGLKVLQEYFKNILTEHESLCLDDAQDTALLAELLAERVTEDLIIGI